MASRPTNLQGDAISTLLMSQFVPLALIRVACLYFVLAALAIVVTRYDGGVAFLWFATAYLLTELSSVPRRRWLAIVLAASFGSIAATGLFGFGWAAALPMAVANMTEALIAAYLIRIQARQAPLESLSLLARYAISVAITAPITSSLIVGLVMWPMGIPIIPTMAHWIVGHGLSNFTFAPIVQLIAQGEFGKSIRDLRSRRGEMAALFGAMTVAIALAFGQDRVPLLFLPVLPILIVTFRLGRGAAAISILALAIMGGSATLAGIGSAHLLPGDQGIRAQFFQFYLAITVMTVWPVAADLRHRARLNAKLQLSEGDTG